jgi:hypothetical protein
VSPLLGGLLSDTDFSYTPRETSDGSFPIQFDVQVNFLGMTVQKKMYQQEGIIKTSSLNSGVYIQNGVDVNELMSENLVIYF